MSEAAIGVEGAAAASPRRAITAAGIGNVLGQYDAGVERRANIILTLTTLASVIVCPHQVRRFRP